MVPLDGSPAAEHALPRAAAIAQRANACIRIVAVLPGAGFLEPEDLPSAVSERLRRGKEQLSRYVDRVVATLRATSHVRATGSVRIDAPVDGLLKEMEDKTVDLVVMTSHGRGGLKRAWLGSVTDALLRRAAVPVLVVKPTSDSQPDWKRPGPALDSVVVPLDGSTVAEAALEPAAALAELYGASLILLQVVTTPYVVPPTAVPYGMVVDHIEVLDRRSRAEDYLQRVAERVRAEGLTATPIVIDQESIAEGIVAHSENGAETVIALATHGIGGVKRLLLGSVADKVLRLAEAPVMVVRPEEAQPGDETTRHALHESVAG
ncbi:MAG TPA: universal stress protein [Longimicrobiales bacterium]|nr:universal stress protein [Longimicrobiales bacterium]